MELVTQPSTVVKAFPEAIPWFLGRDEGLSPRLRRCLKITVICGPSAHSPENAKKTDKSENQGSLLESSVCPGPQPGEEVGSSEFFQVDPPGFEARGLGDSGSSHLPPPQWVGRRRLCVSLEAKGGSRP